MFASWAADEARAPRLSVLDDPSPAIRAAAAEGLGWSGNVGATQPLLARLAAAGEPAFVKAAALRALGRIGDQSARPEVLAATQSNEPSVRAAALWAVSLGELHRREDRTPMLIRLATERAADAQTRVFAIHALGQGTRTADVVSALATLLEHEPPIPMPLLAPAASQHEVMGARFRQARDVRAWAADGLGRLDARETLPLIAKAAQDPDDFFLRQLALRVLVVWGEPAGRPVLVRALADPFAENRLLAVQGLAQTGDRQYVPALLARLGDPEAQVRVQVIAAVAQLGDPAAIPALEKLKEVETDPLILGDIESAIDRLRGR
jgi:HEAT repeat protein